MKLPPRPEYPRPLLVRHKWLNLNGTWRFKQDPANSGLIEGWYRNSLETDASINVPFPIESELSGIGDSNPSTVVWYQREFTVPDGWQNRIQLRIGACDHWTRVFINGQEAGQHRGGYAPFSFDVSHLLSPANNILTIRVEDSLSWTQPRGKQAGTTKWPIDYDAVTGIWQTIWLEPLPQCSIENLHTRYSHNTSVLTVSAGFSGQVDGQLTVSILKDGSKIQTASVNTQSRAEAKLTLSMPEPMLWSPESPTLYDLELILTPEGQQSDTVTSYVGLREVGFSDGKLQLNGKPLYLRGVLDQGYFPGGWYTAANDDALKQDIELTLAMGFNCARKHQKAEDPRYLYWADKLGLLVWAEMPSGRIFSTELVETLTSEWIDLIKRDRGHPSIIAWVPFNESWGIWNQANRPEQRAFADAIYHLTRSLDQSRPVVGNDGWEYSSGDLWTLHSYDDSDSLADHLEKISRDPSSPVAEGDHNRPAALVNSKVSHLALLLTECGGIGYGKFSEEDFSYGDTPVNEDELTLKIQEMMQTINSVPDLQGFVWTQLTDIQQEINGLLYFDRTPKLPITTLKALFGKQDNEPDA